MASMVSIAPFLSVADVEFLGARVLAMPEWSFGRVFESHIQAVLASFQGLTRLMHKVMLLGAKATCRREENNRLLLISCC